MRDPTRIAREAALTRRVPVLSIRATYSRGRLVLERPQKVPDWIKPLLLDVAGTLEPFETASKLAFCVFADDRTGAFFCDIHITAKALVDHSTIDVPLDPEAQPGYRANREIVEDAYAFKTMKEDAKHGPSFSNIVAEFARDTDSEHPLKIIGGQHRFEAIREALEAGVGKYHGVKVYLGLTVDQRLDVQLIANTNIAASSDLYDRMQETHKGPELRKWCQTVGLLNEEQDFADRPWRGAVTVRMARTFILSYFKGSEVDPKQFDISDTTPIIAVSGQLDPEWEKVRAGRNDLWTYRPLLRAGAEFARLVNAQRGAFVNSKTKASLDQPEKALSAAILAAWAYVAGMLHKNDVRLKRHYDMANTSGHDPLNAAALSSAKHRTDPDTYRGLGTNGCQRSRAACRVVL